LKALRRAVAAVLVGGSLASASTAADLLAEGFENPPADARPLVFWQWVNGNVSQEGIRLDLEWMKRVGLAGVLMFDIGFRTPPVPQYVAQRVGFGTPQWRAAVSFAAGEAKRLGLLMGAQSSGGWSVSGGPSVPPEQAMKKLVWSETVVTPRSPRDLRLPAPPSASGPYQDVAISNPEFREPVRAGDVAVIAFRLPESEAGAAPPAALLQGAGVDAAAAAVLQDNRHDVAVTLIPDAPGDIVLEARLKFVPQSVTLGSGTTMPEFQLESSRDGKQYAAVQTRAATLQLAPVTTLALDARHRFWRIRLRTNNTPLKLTEFRFERGARLNLGEAKAGFGVPRNDYPDANAAEVTSVVDPVQVQDLTGKLRADGSLSWRPDRGRWLVQRFGWSLTGRRTVPATAESLGLEVDKLDRAAVRSFAESFYGQYADAVGTSGRLDIALTDSWEAGQQNWSPNLPEQFLRLRGYDLRPWMPALTGRIIGSTAATEQFLADFRRTIADLVAEHYATIGEVAHRRGMTYYSQAPGTDLPTLVDSLAAKGRVDVPTAEFWYWPQDQSPQSAHVADVREAAAAAHLYGKPLVAVESLTSRGEAPWSQGPAQWRRMIDRFFAEGANRVILHTSVHQPFTDRRPGITLRQYGQHFTRNETWAEDAGAWVTYLARTSHLLQQGRHVADLAWYVGGGTPQEMYFLENGELPRPRGIDFDLINDEMIASLTLCGERLCLPGGASYRALQLDRTPSTPAAARNLESLAGGGALLLGAHPAAIENVQLAFSRNLLPPDVETDSGQHLHWTHRTTADSDIYFLTNQSAQEFSGRVTFRIDGRHAEIWNAVTGSRLPANYSATGGRTAVQAEIPAWSSLFVVFRDAAKPVAPAGEPRRVPLFPLDGPWNVRFLDAPAQDEELKLSPGSLTRQSSPDIRFFSGRAVYQRRFSMPASRLASGLRVELDLGAVGDLARVRVNGRDLGVWWSPPFRGDITDALRPGNNDLEITITNYWANRLIGDEQPDAKKVTFSSHRPYQADSPLRPAGLLGPVQLISLIPGKKP
jgi:hypothetical protein